MSEVTRTCDHCGKRQKLSDLAVIWSDGIGTYLCHPADAIGTTCYMDVGVNYMGAHRD